MHQKIFPHTRVFLGFPRYKFENPEKTSKSYALPKDKESRMHDDRFYTIIMLAHYLYELRRGQVLVTENSDYDFCTFIN